MGQCGSLGNAHASFLRTTEFLWQEGHTAHATEQEAVEETNKMVGVYADFAREIMALPVWVGPKTASERFAGAVDTLCIEAPCRMESPSGRNVAFWDKILPRLLMCSLPTRRTTEYVWATSWGVSTRLMGALVMAHSDNHGLVLPPLLAPIQVVLVPIYKGEEERVASCSHLEQLKEKLEAKGLKVKLDDRDNVRSGFKFTEWEVKGVPLRLAVGPRDLANGTVELARRDTLTKEVVPLEGVEDKAVQRMKEIQDNIYRKALDFREKNTFEIDSYSEFCNRIEEGGFSFAIGTVQQKQKPGLGRNKGNHTVDSL